MEKLTRDNLWSLEQYASERAAFREHVIDHKRNRRVKLGPHATLLFEDHLSMKYQVQEMLRIERIFEPEQIAEEIEAYNPLIPDGSNWKATLMIEFPDAEERRVALTRMLGIEHKVWAQVAGHERIFAIANEDLERTDDEKTSAVHFLRFELERVMVRALKDGAALAMGIDHGELPYKIDPIDGATRAALVADLDG